MAATSLAAYLLGRMVGGCHLINDLKLAAHLHVLSAQDTFPKLKPEQIYQREHFI